MNKRTISILILLSLCLPACLAGRGNLPRRDAPHPFEVDWDDRSPFAEGLIASERDALDGLPGATVYHIELALPRAMDTLHGREQLRLTNREPAALDEIVLRLYPNVTGGRLTLSNVRVDGHEVTPATESADSAARLPLPTPLAPGEHVVIELDFTVEVAREMGGNYGLFGYFEDVLVLDEFYPMVAAYDDQGWDAETPARNGDLTYLDASFYLVRVIAPAGWTVVASGVEIGRAYEKRDQVLTYAAGPARDFYLAASERYLSVSEQVGETVVHGYALKGSQESAAAAARHAGQALARFNDRFGPYPYTELDVLSTPMRALGIEYPGAVGIALSMYDPDATVSGLPAPVILESVVAHEVAHQWFYNVVGNDQQQEPWLDEAVVQYATGLYYLDMYGPQAAASYRASWQDRWNRVDGVATPIGLPAGAYSSEDYSPIVYGRGPFFVQALAEQMGQETFDRFMRDYYHTYRWEIATTEGFRRLAETHCGCDLQELFTAWVYGDEQNGAGTR